MPSSPSSIQLHLLNAPRLERGGETIVINRRKALALFAYLALTGQIHLRDSLAALLWPDSGQAFARGNLRHTLVALKQVAGDHILDLRGDQVALKPDAALWIDVQHFQNLLANTRLHNHATGDLCPTCLALLLEAVSMPIEQFMAGFSLTDSPAFDDWQRFQQQQLLMALCDALDRLIHYFVRAGNYKAAIEHAQRRLSIDTLDEAAHRQLMQLYAWSGQQGLASRQFEQCSELLATELGVSPSAETLRLIEEIQAGLITLPTAAPRSINGHRPIAEPILEPIVHANNGSSTRALPPHNLPVRLPALIGRKADLAALRELVLRRDVNLVTLVGPGGVGKTQLGLKVASLLLDQFPDGVFLVSLASLDDPELVILALAQALDLTLQRNRTVLESVQNYLRDKHMLLLVDNFDHLMAAAPLVSDLLAHCSHLRILVASRELLHVQGEHVYPVAPLSLPGQAQLSSLSAVAESAAVQLFVQRAQAIMPGFVLDESNAEDVAAICVHLDGLPLAIELVVARIRLLPPRVLRQRLLGSTASSFEILQGGMRDAPARHHTLKDAIGWSYNLLTVAEQRLFRLFSTFVGGCTFDAVERICELAGQENHHSVLELLSSLINKSLLRQAVQPNGEMRFSMLEMIREYALEQAKAAGDFDQANRAHAETFALFAEVANAALSSPDDLAWIARLNSEQDNCRAALQWAITNQDIELAMRLGGALWTFWLDRGYYREGGQFLEAILQLDGAANRTPGRANLLTGLGAIHRANGNKRKSRALLDEAVSIYRECGDVRGLASALERITEGCYLDIGLAQPEYYHCFVEAIALYEKLGDRISAARTRQQFGHEKYHVGDYRAAEAIFAETLPIFEEEQYEAGIGSTLCNLGRALFQQRRFVEADRQFAEALSRAQARGDQKLEAFLIYFRGRIAYYQDDFSKAKLLFEESMRIHRKFGAKAAGTAFPLMFLSDIALDAGELASAQTMLKEALTSVYQEHDVYAVPLILPHCASVAVAHANYFSAVQLVAAGHTLYTGLKLHLPINDQMTFDAPLAAARPFLSADEFDQAMRLGAQMTMAEAVELALAAMQSLADVPFAAPLRSIGQHKQVQTGE